MTMERSQANWFKFLMDFMSSRDEEPRQSAELHKQLKKDKDLGHMTNKNGYTPLHVGIQMEVPFSKLAMLLQDQEVARQVNPAGRLPLHMAMDYYVKAEVLHKLLDTYKPAVHAKDVDGRLPLHMVLEHQPFHPFLTGVAIKMIDIFPAAVRVPSSDGRLPLHMALDRGLPQTVVLKIIECGKSEAASTKRDGSYPLHIALANDFEAAIINSLVEACPSALMAEMQDWGGRVLPLEFAVKKNLPSSVIQTLIASRSSDNPRVAACAFAAMTGRISKEFRNTNRTKNRTRVLLLRRENDRLVLQEKTEDPKHLAQEDIDMVKCSVCTPTAEELTLLLCDSKGKIEDLRLGVQAAEARFLGLQDSEGTEPRLQRLTLGEQQLMDGRSLADYGVVGECRILFQRRYDILHLALRAGLSDDFVLEILRLRPEAAKEDDRNGVMPLHSAMMHNATESVVKQIFTHNPEAAKMEVSGKLGHYPLHLALQGGYSCEVVKLMLQAPWTPAGTYDPGGKATSHGTQILPLHMAIESSGPSSVKNIIRLLLDSKCPVGARDQKTGQTALECVLSCCPGNDQLFQRLLQATMQQDPGSLREEGPQGHTLLDMACMCSASVGIIEQICEMNPAFLSHSGPDRRLPLHLALMHGLSFSTVRALLSRCPESVHVPDGVGRLPIQIAVLHKVPPGVVALLIEKCPRSIHNTDCKGHGLLDIAVAADAPTWILAELLEGGCHRKSINLMSVDWPDTRAASEVMRMLRNPRRTWSGPSSLDTSPASGLSQQSPLPSRLPSRQPSGIQQQRLEGPEERPFHQPAEALTEPGHGEEQAEESPADSSCAVA